MTEEEMIDGYNQAATAPKTPYWVQLAAGLSMAGLKVMPSRLIPKMGRVLRKISSMDEVHEDDLKVFYAEAEFILEENHCRSEPHEMWQGELGDTYKNDYWVVPVDEIVSITYKDKYACDFVSIQRLLFAGTERDLEDAIDTLTAHLKKLKKKTKKAKKKVATNSRKRKKKKKC